MMGEVEEDEQKFVCKFCHKICLSGKSLGGHMRCHLSLIAASRNSVKVEDDINMNCENDDHDGVCGFEEKPNFTGKNHEIWDDQDQDSYILRENPKKSLRISYLRIESNNKDGVFCKKCSKKFPSTRALAGHMRTHSTKGKPHAKHHICRECGKGFVSVKGLFGHMKIHSKIYRVSTESDGLSDLEFCYPKKKRSVTKYRMSESYSVSSAKESASASVIGIDQADVDAAACLVMLSNGVTERDVFNSLQESATNDAISSDSLDKGIAKIDEIEHNLCFLDKKTEFENDCSDKLKMYQQEDASSVQFDENKISRQSHFTKGKKEESGKYEDSCKKKEYKCRNCKMVFNSHQALGGHSNRHKIMISSSTEINIQSGNQSSETLVEEGSFRMALTDFEMIRSQEHECEICFKIFQTGKALGGHKRAHFNNTLPNEDRMKEIMVNNQDISTNLGSQSPCVLPN